MTKSIFWILGLCLFLVACNNTAKTMEEADTNHFGEKITADGAIKYDALLAKMGTADSLELKVEGTVSEVCQMKGCWMTIVSNDENQEAMMVKFKDYGFFMPKDISGKTVVMRGKAFREETPVDELRHYAEDAGKSAEEIAAITEPKVELKFLADGVVIKP